MANIGLKRIYVWLVGSDNKVLTGTNGLSDDGVYVVDTDANKGNLGLKTANITGLSGTVTKIAGNNVVVAVSNPPSAPSVAIDANAINFTIKQKLLGRVETSVKGAYVDGETIPKAGLIIESSSPTTGKSVFYGFGIGQFTEASQNVQTNTDTAEQRDDDNLTFTALGCPHFPNESPVIFGNAAENGFTKNAFFDLVAPGQTLVSASQDKTPGNVSASASALSGTTTTLVGGGTTHPDTGSADTH